MPESPRIHVVIGQQSPRRRSLCGRGARWFIAAVYVEKAADAERFLRKPERCSLCERALIKIRKAVSK